MPPLATIMLRGASLVLALLLSLGGGRASSSASPGAVMAKNLRGAPPGPCHESFPLAPPASQISAIRRATVGSSSLDHLVDHNIRLAVPGDLTRRSHAPLCHTDDDDDGSGSSSSRRLDIRRLGECQPGQCFASMYQMCMHITSQECQAEALGIVPTGKPTERPTPAPTPKPTFGMETTVQPVKVILLEVAEDFALTMDVRVVVMRKCSEILEQHLEGPLEFLEVESGGFLNGRSRRLQGDDDEEEEEEDDDDEEQVYDADVVAVPIALNVRVKGPKDMTDYALAFVIETLQAHKDGIEESLREYNDDNFRDVAVEISSFQIAEVAEETDQPTSKPSTRPTRRSTPKPTARDVDTIHPVAIFFRDVPDGYRLGPGDRLSLIALVREMIQDDLDESLELEDVSYPGRLRHDEGPNARALPLLIKVRGATDVSDFALALLMEAFESRRRSGDNLQRLCEHMKDLSWEDLRTCNVKVTTYDLADIVGDTTSPTPGPTPSGPVTMTHPIQLIFEGVPLGYTFSSRERSALLRYVEGLVKDRLDPELELIEVEHAGYLLTPVNSRLTASMRSGTYLTQFPMLVTVRGPRELVEEFSMALVIRLLGDSVEDVEDFLESIGEEALANPEMSVSTFDPDDLVDTSKTEETTHAVELVFDRAPPGYEFSPVAKNTMLLVLKGMLGEGKLGPFELGDVDYYTGSDGVPIYGRGKAMRFLQSEEPPSLPLLITVEGPEAASESALPYIMQVLRDNMGVLEDFLKSTDGEAFEDPSVSVDEYWGEPYSPEVKGDEEDAPSLWWLWLVLTLVILCLLCCLCFCCWYYGLYRDTRKTKEISDDEPVKVTPMVVEQPVIYERPVIMDDPMKEKKKKKAHKKKKKKKKKRRVLRIEQPQVLQIEQPAPQVLQIEQPQPREIRYEGPEIAVPNRHPADMTARSLITFNYEDPPTEQYSYYNGAAPPSAASSSRSTLLALPAPPVGERSMRSRREDPSAHFSRYSVIDPSQQGGVDDFDMMYDKDGNRSGYLPHQIQPSGSSRLPYYSKEPSGHQLVDESSFATRSTRGGTLSSRSKNSYDTQYLETAIVGVQA